MERYRQAGGVMAAYFRLGLDLQCPNDWDINDIRMALAYFAQEHEIKIEGSVKQIADMTTKDIEYFRID